MVWGREPLVALTTFCLSRKTALSMVFNPFDGHTLGDVLKQTAALTGVTPERAHVDRGYRGHKQNMHTPDPASGLPTRPPWRVFISGRKALNPP
jgi:hypothetical protein